jgi:hypothetical protein
VARQLHIIAEKRRKARPRTVRFLVLGAVVFAACVARADAQSTPLPSPSPPPETTSVVLSSYAFGSRADVSNALISIAGTAGTFRYGLTTGAYSFPVLGAPLVSAVSAGANTSLYGYVPTAYFEYAPSGRIAVMAGKLGSLLGQESVFTFQNINIQRGLGWNAEPLISRGARLIYTPGKLTADVEVNDGYYSGSRRAVEGLAGWAFTPRTSVQLAWIIPDANTPGNPTTAIANKAEYDFMINQSMGKLQLSPYLLLVHSPASATAGFARAESAWTGVFLADYAFSTEFSLGARYEHAQDDSNAADPSANADLIGFGPGSAADTLTLTPSYTFKQLTMRAEYSLITATGALSQARFGAELEVQF